MSRAKKPKTNVDKLLLLTMQWTCTHFGRQSEIEAHVASTGKWETIATVHSAADCDAEDIAGFIVCAVGKYREGLDHGAVRTKVSSAS